MYHSSGSERRGDKAEFAGESRPADSAARVIYEYYGGKKRLPHFKTMVREVDKVDSDVQERIKLYFEQPPSSAGWS